MDKSNRDFKSMLSKITEAVIDTSSPDFKHMLSKARDAAAGGINAMSKGEALAAALVLNRPDWLAAMSHTIAEAIDRIGPTWAILVPAVAKEFERDAQTAAYASAERTRLARHDELASRQQIDSELDFSAKLLTYGDAPGYRDVTFTFDLGTGRRKPAADRPREHSYPPGRWRTDCRTYHWCSSFRVGSQRRPADRREARRAASAVD